MRLIKILGLTAVAAMAAMAFMTSAASADPNTFVLCEIAELECTEDAYPNPTTIVGHAEDPELHTSIGTAVCDESLAELTLLNELRQLILSHILSLTFIGCKLGSTTCTVTATKLGDNSITHKAEPLEGLVTSTGGTEANVKCGSLINCTYGGTPSLTLHSLNDGMTHLLTNETELTVKKGFFCPKTSKWDASYLALGEYYVES